MILDTAAGALGAAAHFDPARWTHRLAHRSEEGGAHFILGDGTARHRIWLRGDPGGGPPVAAIPCDALVETRLQALSDLARWLSGRATVSPVALPTAYQARRLALLLSILDLRERAPVTSHEVARRLIYPRMGLGRGAAWKASPERRRTQRLIREAGALAAGGYRALLAGRQK